MQKSLKNDSDILLSFMKTVLVFFFFFKQCNGFFFWFDIEILFRSMNVKIKNDTSRHV